MVLNIFLTFLIFEIILLILIFEELFSINSPESHKQLYTRWYKPFAYYSNFIILPGLLSLFFYSEVSELFFKAEASYYLGLIGALFTIVVTSQIWALLRWIFKGRASYSYRVEENVNAIDNFTQDTDLPYESSRVVMFCITSAILFLECSVLFVILRSI